MIETWKPLYAVDEALAGAALAPAEASEAPAEPAVPEVPKSVSVTTDELTAAIRRGVSDEIDARYQAASAGQAPHAQNAFEPWDPERNAIRAISLRDQMLDEAMEALGEDATPQMMKALRSDLGQFTTAQDIHAAMQHGIHRTIADAHYARAVRQGNIVPSKLRSSAPVVAPRREPTGGGSVTHSSFERYAQETNASLEELGMPKLTRGQLQQAWNDGDGRRFA